MSDSTKVKRVSKKEPATRKKNAKQLPREVSKKKKVSTGRRNDDAPIVIITENASTTNLAETVEWYPVRHPRLSMTAAPRYFVNKLGHVCSNREGELRPMRRIEAYRPRYDFRLTDGKACTIKVEEIMMYTFSEQRFDDQIHYIYHKDGRRENCELDNLIVCDLPTLQKLEIARLQESHLGSKYTVVRNLHDTLTFERYLVSDAGKIYSLISRRHIGGGKVIKRHQIVTLCPDTYMDARHLSTRRCSIPVPSVVLQSFIGRQIEKLEIIYINGDVLDNSLQNLTYRTKSKRHDYDPIKTEDVGTQKKQNAPVNPTAQPLAAITKETRDPASQFEVSDMAHVSKMIKTELLALLYINSLYAFVSICQDSKLNDSTMTPMWRTKAQVPRRGGASLWTTAVENKILSNVLPGIGTTVAFSIWKGSLQSAVRSTDPQPGLLCYLWDQTI